MHSHSRCDQSSFTLCREYFVCNRRCFFLCSPSTLWTLRALILLHGLTLPYAGTLKRHTRSTLCGGNVVGLLYFISLHRIVFTLWDIGCKLCRPRSILTPGQLWYRAIPCKHFETFKLSDSGLLKLAKSLNFEFGPALGLEPVAEFKLWLALRSRNQLFDLKETLFGTQSMGWICWIELWKVFFLGLNSQGPDFERMATFRMTFSDYRRWCSRELFVEALIDKLEQW